MRLNCLMAGVLAGAVLTGRNHCGGKFPTCREPMSNLETCYHSGCANTASPSYTIRDMDDLVRMSRCDLENLYRSAEIGCPPSGVHNGRAIINAGSKLTVPASKVVRVLWQGKVISDDDMVNRVFGVRAVHARVYTGESWFDGKPS